MNIQSEEFVKVPDIDEHNKNKNKFVCTCISFILMIIAAIIFFIIVLLAAVYDYKYYKIVVILVICGVIIFVIGAMSICVMRCRIDDEEERIKGHYAGIAAYI